MGSISGRTGLALVPDHTEARIRSVQDSGIGVPGKARPIIDMNNNIYYI